MKTRISILTGLLLLVFLSTSSSCKKDEDPSSNEVFIEDNSFNPGTMTVSVGTTVKWTNKGSSAHTVTSDSNDFDSGSMSKGSTFSHIFSTAGTFNYHCEFHNGMNGIVKVN